MLLALTLLLFSCRTELESNEQFHEKDQGIGKTISFSTLLLKLGEKNVSKEFGIPTNIFSKTPVLTNFVIDESKIIELENSASDANYSMVIYPKMPKDDNVFYNLIIRKTKGEISKIIYKYTPDTNWFNDFNNKTSRPYQGAIDLVYQEGNFSASKTSKAVHCHAEYIQMPCEFGLYHNDADCEGSGSPYIKITVCEDMGGPGGGSTISYGGSSGPSGGGSGGAIVTPLSLETPFPYGNEYNTAYQNFKFDMHFASNEKIWLSSHTSASVNLFWYVYGMGNTDEAFAVAKKYIQFAIAGGISFNSIPFSLMIDFIIEAPNTTWNQFNNWFIKGSLDFQNVADVEFAKDLSNLSYDLLIANQNGTLNQLQTSWPNWQKIKQKIKNSIADGVHSTAKVVKTFYDEVRNNPYLYNTATQVVLNIYIDQLREEIRQTTNMNKDTMNWQDLFNIWLFELMPNKYNNTINFTWNSNIINGSNLYNPTTNAVFNFPKGDYEDPVTHNKTPLINKLNASLSNNSMNVGSVLSGYFKYDFAQYYATLSNSNNGIQMLGSYLIDAKIISKGNGIAVIQFYIYNILGWDSGTRFVQTGNGTIGFIPNKEIGDELHLGGNIKNTYTWQETILY